MTTPRLTLLTASLALTLSTISGLAGAHTPDGAVAPGASTWTMMPSVTIPAPTSELIARRGRGTEDEADEGETDDSGADPDLSTTPESLLAKGRRNDDATVETDDSGADPDHGGMSHVLLAKNGADDTGPDDRGGSSGSSGSGKNRGDREEDTPEDCLDANGLPDDNPKTGVCAAV